MVLGTHHHRGHEVLAPVQTSLRCYDMNKRTHAGGTGNSSAPAPVCGDSEVKRLRDGSGYETIDISFADGTPNRGPVSWPICALR